MRTIRILRIFKLAKTWKNLQRLLVILWQTLIDIASFTVILFIFMYIYTVLGMELFAERIKFTNDVPDLANG